MLDTQQDLVITRTLNAPRDKVWKSVVGGRPAWRNGGARKAARSAS